VEAVPELGRLAIRIWSTIGMFIVDADLPVYVKYDIN